MQIYSAEMTISDQINDTLSALDAELRDAENRVRRLQRAIDALREVQPTSPSNGAVRPPAPPARGSTLAEGDTALRSMDLTGSQATLR